MTQKIFSQTRPEIKKNLYFSVSGELKKVYKSQITSFFFVVILVSDGDYSRLKNFAWIIHSLLCYMLPLSNLGIQRIIGEIFVYLYTRQIFG